MAFNWSALNRSHNVLSVTYRSVKPDTMLSSGYKHAITPFKVKVDPKLKQQKYITYGLDPGTPPGPRSGFAGSGLFPNKEWEDLCFRCYDEGELLMCDFRTCPKVRETTY